MANNPDKISKLHDLMPKIFKTKTNKNWKAIIEAIGESDQNTADLVEAVRKQLFVKTAERPYLDRLAANNKVSRPKFIGMDDPTFREYIPVVAYMPKQVKSIINKLLDLFFFKESTTAYIQSTLAEPFNIIPNSDLQYTLDSYKSERIKLSASDFTNMASIKADELVAAINRQAKYSFAVSYNDSPAKKTYIRIFSNTIGSNGSIQVIGGLSNIGLKFEGFNYDAGNGVNTQWNITKIGDEVKFQYIGGDSPSIAKVQAKDTIISNIPNNSGSFIIEKVDISDSAIYFRNSAGTSGIYTQTSANDVKFIQPYKSTIAQRNRKAAVWEVSPGEMVVEMPTSPPIVKRKLSGSIHINGTTGVVKNVLNSNQIELFDASSFPKTGSFMLQPQLQIITRNDNDSSISSNSIQTRLDMNGIKYEYTSKTGNIISGITPNLPSLASLNEFNIVSGNRTSNIVTITTASANNFSVGDNVIIINTSGPIISANGVFSISSIISPTQFTYASIGDDATLTVASNTTARVEKYGLSNANSKIFLTNSQVGTKITGAYIWDDKALFVQSNMQGTLGQNIYPGNSVKIMNIGTNNITQTSGEIIVDFGLNTQEGPIRYLYKPNDNTLYVDPSYVWQKRHTIGAAISVIRHKGAHIISKTGREYAPYITDPSIGRITLENLIRQVKSAGIFVNFLVKYPETVYGSFDVYDSGVDPDVAINELLRNNTSA